MNLDTLSSDSSEEEFRDVIPVPDSLGEEATCILIDIFTGLGYLKGQGGLIPAPPCLGNKVISRYPGFTFQTFLYNNMSQLVLLPGQITKCLETRQTQFRLNGEFCLFLKFSVICE